MQSLIHRGRTLAALTAALLLAGPALAEPVGFLAEAEGTVELKSGGAGSFAAAAQDSDVSIGDTIRTGRDSGAKLVLVDDTIITIDEETELVIDKYVVGPSAATEPSKLDLLAGHMRTRVGEAFGGPTRLQVHTPTAVIGVKGTEFYVWSILDPLTTYTCVISGIVTVESNEPDLSGTYEPPVGGCARVLPHARPEPADLRDVGGGPINVFVDPVTDQLAIELNDIPIDPPTPTPPMPTPTPTPTPPKPKSAPTTGGTF
jgi:ferric-dicitrate binding protein FerR (iron transport regulator)